MHGYLVQGRYCKVEVGKTKDWCTRSAILKTTISDHKTYLAARSIALALALSRDDSESKEARVGVEFGWLSHVQALVLKRIWSAYYYSNGFVVYQRASVLWPCLSAVANQTNRLRLVDGE